MLGKKGKVVSAIVKNLEHSNIAVGMSFNLLNYEKVQKISTVGSRVIIVGENSLNIFTVG